MSEGIRSGVNWMRLKLSESASASVEMSSVFARPGTPTKRQCPREKRAIRSCSITASWPTTRLAISWAMRARARESSSISSASDEANAPLMASSLMMCLFGRDDSGGERQRLALALLECRILEGLRQLQIGGVQFRVEGVHRDPVVERHARFVQRSPLEQDAAVERLRGFVVRILLRSPPQRLFGLGETPELHLRGRIAPRDLRDFPRQVLPGAPVLLRRRAPAPARVEDVAQPRGPLSLLAFGDLGRGGVEWRRLGAALRVLLEDELLRNQ